MNREIFRVFRVSGRGRRSRDARRARPDAVFSINGEENFRVGTGKPTGKEQGASRERNRATVVSTPCRATSFATGSAAGCRHLAAYKRSPQTP